MINRPLCASGCILGAALLALSVSAVADHRSFQPDHGPLHGQPVRERPDLRQDKHREFQPGPERGVIGHRSEHSFPALRNDHRAEPRSQPQRDPHRHQRHRGSGRD